MAQELNIEQKLNDLLETHNFHPEFMGKDGRPCKDASTAKTFSFDYIGSSGNNYGTMVIVLGDDNEMFILYGDNLGKTIEDHKDQDDFFEFQHTLTNLAHRNRWHATLTDISKLKHIQAGIAAITEGLFEGYYGNKRVSYAGEPTEARLMLKHNRVLGENDARFRYVESIFIETADGERFKLPFTNLGGGRAMLEHVKQGGKPYDIRGNHICEMIVELKVLSRFNRASAGRVMEGVTQEIVEQAKTYYKNLREHIKRMGTHRGYSTYFESWHPAESLEHEELVEDIKTMFIEQTLDTRIEDALPLLARIQQGNVMKEADIFESWIDHLSEGTWNLPETPEQLAKLKELMSKELIVGPDATNATEQLYDLVGDDVLFDRLGDLAERDPRANAWNDTEVIRRLEDLGIDISTDNTPAAEAPPEAAAAVAPAAPAAGAPAPPVAEGYYKDPDGDDESAEDKEDKEDNEKRRREEDDLAEGETFTTFEDIHSLAKLAGIPVREGRDHAGSEYIDELVGKILALEKPGMSTDRSNDDFFKAVYDELIEIGLTPKAARYKINYDEDFVGDVASAYHHFSSHPEVKEGAAVDAYMAGKSPALAHFADQLDKSHEVKEGSCNMTTEGEYCPEHGLMECGGMYEMGTVAGSMAPVMGENLDDRAYFVRNNIWTVMDGDEEVMQHEVESGPMHAKRLMRELDDQGYDFTHVVSPEGHVTYLPQFDPRRFPKDGMDEGVMGNMFNKAKSMFTKPAAAPAAPAPVVPNAATQARIAAAPQGYDPNTGKPQVAAAAAPGAVAKGGTMDMTKKVVAPVATPAAAPAQSDYSPQELAQMNKNISSMDPATLAQVAARTNLDPTVTAAVKAEVARRKGVAEGVADMHSDELLNTVRDAIRKAIKETGDQSLSKIFVCLRSAIPASEALKNITSPISLEAVDNALQEVGIDFDDLLNFINKQAEKYGKQGVAEGENFATFEDIHSLTKLAGIPVAESRLMDATGETIDHILDRFKHEVRNFEAAGDLDDDLYHALYDYYSNNGDMPYGTMKARTGDPYEWVSDHLAKHLGMNEGVLGTVGGAMLGSVMGGPVGAAVGGVAGQEMTKGGSGIVESSCNQTMEGEYCPEHGLMECGSSMYEMSTVAGSVASGVVTPAQNMAEGTALLARIKSLALIR